MGEEKVADIFCAERFAACFRQRKSSITTCTKTRSRFTLLVAEWARCDRHHRWRVLSKQLDRRNADSAFELRGISRRDLELAA